MLMGGGDLHGYIRATKELNTCTSTTKSSTSQFTAHTSSPKRTHKEPRPLKKIHKTKTGALKTSCWTIQKFQVSLANIDIFV